MLRRLFLCAVRLHPASFRRRFGDEMLYIFDQQTGTLAALEVMLDCVFSLLRQWTLRPRIGAELPATALPSPAADHVPRFESLDPFQPRTSAIVHGALLSLILFYVTVISIPYSWIHVLHVRFPQITADSPQPLSSNPKKLSGGLQVDVIPAESGNPQTSGDAPGKTVVSSSLHTSAAPVQTRGVTIWLDPYVGTYISDQPAAKISIQFESDPFRGNHLSISVAGSGQSVLALSPLSRTKFVISGVENSYVDFTADVQGRICCLSWVVNGKATTAQRQ